MTLLLNTYHIVLPHHFLAVWQEFARQQIPRIMPVTHALCVTDYIMKSEFACCVVILVVAGSNSMKHAMRISRLAFTLTPL